MEDHRSRRAALGQPACEFGSVLAPLKLFQTTLRGLFQTTSVKGFDLFYFILIHNFSEQLNLNTCAKRQRYISNRRARMASSFAKNLL